MNIGLSDVRSVVTRSALLLAFAGAIIIVPYVTADPALRAVFPLMSVLLLTQFAPVMWSKDPDLFAPPIFTGILAGIGTAATLASWYVNGELTLDLVPDTSSEEIAILAEKTALALLIGAISYLIGYYSNLGLGLRKIFPKVRDLVWDRRRVFFVSAAAGTISLLCYAFFQSQLGLPLLDFTQLGAGKAVWRDDPTLSWMIRGLEAGLLPVILFFSWTMAQKRGLRSLVVPALILFVAAAFLLRLGQRGPPAYALLVMLIIFHYHRRRVPAMLFIGLCFAGMVTSNVVLGWRVAPEDEIQTSSATAIDEASDPTAALASHETDRQRFSSVALLMKEFPDSHPYLMGRSWIGIPAAPIPRWLWPDKVNHFEWQDNRIVFNLVGAPVPPPYVGVLYANLSWIGVVLGTLMLGAFHRGLYEWLRESDGDMNVVLLYALFVLYFGPTSIQVSATLQYIVPMWLILRFVGRRAHPALAAA